jgi:hypothetical protein
MANHEMLLGACDEAWAVYQRFRTLGATESEATHLTEAVMKAAISGAIIRAGKPS